MAEENKQNPYSEATKWLKELGIYLTVVTATLAAVAQYQEKLTSLFQNQLGLGLVPGLILAWLLLLAPVLLVFACRTVPALWKKRNENRLMQEGIKGELRYPDYFRLTPFEAKDSATFSRADGMHDKILDWVKDSSQSLLYLTGRSGVGKSSIVQAWLIPHLQRAEPAYCVLSVRTFNDPCKALLTALTQAKIWQQLPQEPNLYKLLKKASQKVAPQKLLIVLDQFEEFLILHEQAQRVTFTALLQMLVENPLPNLTLLTIFRSDYNGLIAELQLPLLKQKENWQEVLPFSEAAARRFIAKSGLVLNQTLVEAILRELSELEDTAGLIRPISLNMVGLVIERFAGGQLRGVEVGQLIRSYLQECLRHKEVVDYAAKLLEPMITAHGTKKPMSLVQLAAQCRCEANVVRGVLLRLLQQGLVRSVGDETWEIAHDFAAAQLAQLLPRLPKPVRWAGWVMGVGFVVWVAMFTVGKDFVAMNAQKNLSDARVRVMESQEKGGYVVIITDMKDNALTSFWHQFDLLQWHKPIVVLQITRIDGVQIPALNNTPLLKSLIISENHELQKLPVLNKVPQLKVLIIAGNNGLENFPTLDKIPQLEELIITSRYKFQGLPILDKVPLLKRLDISNNEKLKNFPDLNKLPYLEELHLSPNEILQKRLPQIVNGLSHLSILVPESIFIDKKEIPLVLLPFVLLPNLRLVCVYEGQEKQWLEAEKFVQQRQVAKMPAVEIRKEASDDECKL